MPSVGRFRDEGVPVCLGSLSLSFYFQGWFLSLEWFLFFLMSSWTSVCPLGGCFSPGFLGFFFFPFFPGIFGSFFPFGCVPLFLLGCVHLSRIFSSPRGTRFSPFFPLLGSCFSSESRQFFSLILLRRGQGSCWMEDLHSLKGGVWFRLLQTPLCIPVWAFFRPWGFPCLASPEAGNCFASSPVG